MADFSYTPTKGVIERFGPQTLVERFEDGGTIRREKNAAKWRRFTFIYRQTVATTKAMLDLADAKNLDTIFTIITWDPQATTPSTDEASVLLEKFPKTQQATKSLVDSTWVFVEDPTV